MSKNASPAFVRSPAISHRGQLADPGTSGWRVQSLFKERHDQFFKFKVRECGNLTQRELAID